MFKIRKVCTITTILFYIRKLKIVRFPLMCGIYILLNQYILNDHHQ